MSESSSPQALKRFVARWGQARGPLRSFLNRRGVRAEEIDDALQDIALRLLKSDDYQGKDMEHFQAMAYTAARWVAIDRFRLSRPDEVATDPSTLEQYSPSQTPDPTARIAFSQAWERLSRREQQVLAMREQGRPDREAAEALGVSEATVRSIARRARAKIFDVLF